MVRPFVELRVQCNHAAVGVLELAVDALQFFLPGTDAVERAQQLLVLLADFGERAGRPFRRERRRLCALKSSAPTNDARAGNNFLRLTVVPCGVEDTSNMSISRRVPTMPRPRPVVTYIVRPYVVQMADAGSVVTHADREELRRAAAFHFKYDAAAARVQKRVSRNFRTAVASLA